jgi:hypothetical protein
MSLGVDRFFSRHSTETMRAMSLAANEAGIRTEAPAKNRILRRVILYKTFLLWPNGMESR